MNAKLSNLLLTVVVVMTVALAVKLAAAEPREAPRKSWQHLRLTHDPFAGDTDANTAERINALGNEGWELVAVTHTLKDGSTRRTNYFFKRPL